MAQFKGTPGPWSLDEFDAVVHGEEPLHGWGRKETVRVSGVALPGRVTEEYAANTRLVAAAPELLEALTYGQTLNLPDMLDWVADRLVNVHGENCNLDFIVSIRERASKARAAIAKATGETK